MANEENLTIDGLAVNDGITFGMITFDAPVPRQRQDWIGAADSEAQLLFRNPLHENRKITARIGIVPQSTMDIAHDKLLLILDKLQKASKYTDGITMTWAPATGTRTATFDVLAGEITDLPVDWENGYLAKAPTITIEMTCKPYWRGTEVLTGTASSGTAPFATLEVAGVTGDVPALGRLIITDTASQSRRFVEWGLEGPLTYNSGTSLILDSDNLVTSGFSGTGTTATDAYDPNAAGNSTITGGAYLQTAALCGTGNQSHVGSFRVRARVMSALANSAMFRLSWQTGDAPFTANAWVIPRTTFNWEEHDLGTITIPAATLGSQRWTGRVEVALNPANLGPLGTGVFVDYLTLVPVSDGYGKARASYSYAAGVQVGYDQFTSTTAGAALNARAATSGGTWATSGASTDFAFADDLSGEQVKRSTVSDAGRRFAVLGASSFTDSEVSVGVQHSGGPGASKSLELGAILRWVDSSNYLAVYRKLAADASNVTSRSLVIEQVVAGVSTVLTSGAITSGTSSGMYHTIRGVVFASGRVIATETTAGSVTATVEASSTAIAAGGALATGKPGFLDRSTDTATVNRYYDDFTVSTPATEPIALYSARNMQVRYDDVLRQDSTGTYSGRPASYRGGRFLLPVGTSRVLAHARRNDLETSTSTFVTDTTQLQVGWTPRGLAVPRA